MMIARTTALAAALTVSVAVAAHAGEQIRIVGSSTVFPFATAVAEKFGRTSNFKTPVVESTGSGGGFKLFCAGVGEGYPDITNASRRIKKSEVEKCAGNGVGPITEVKIGFDGIVIANSKDAPPYKLTLRELFLALAKDVPQGGKVVANPYTRWNEIDPKLPDSKIEVLGPPPTSGTRDAFVELAMEGGCKTFADIKALKKTDKKAYKAICQTIREDGGYIEAGENDNLIVQKLVANPAALGIFGYSYLDQNLDKIQGSLVNGTEPTFENISAAKYPVSRSLYFYVKTANVGKVAGMEEYLAEFTSEDAIGDEGYLVDKGLIPLAAADRKATRDKAKALTALTM